MAFLPMSLSTHGAGLTLATILSCFVLQGLSTMRPVPRKTSTYGRCSSAWWTSSVWRCQSVWTWRLLRLQGPRPPDWLTSLPSYLRSAADHPRPAAVALNVHQEKQLITVTFLHSLSALVDVCEQSIIPLLTAVYGKTYVAGVMTMSPVSEEKARAAPNKSHFGVFKKVTTPLVNVRILC